MSAPEQYVVVHECPMGTLPDGTERVDYGIASSVSERPPVNHLAYCRGMQAAGRSGSGGRYFIARLTELEEMA